MKLVLPIPPTANNLFRNVPGKGRVKTGRYRQWLKTAAVEVMIQRKGERIEGPASVTIALKRPRANADLDNRIKPILDALQHGGALANDKQVSFLSACWADVENVNVTVLKDESMELRA